MKKLTLKQALEQDKLKEFIKQNKDLKSDKEKFDNALDSMIRKSKSAHQTSDEDVSEN